LLTAYGAAAVHVHDADVRARAARPGFVAAFACGCALASSYGFLAGTWPFGVVEAIWALIALRRYRDLRRGEAQSRPPDDR
jgi:hypothetical protein